MNSPSTQVKADVSGPEDTLGVAKANSSDPWTIQLFGEIHWYPDMEPNQSSHSLKVGQGFGIFNVPPAFHNQDCKSCKGRPRKTSLDKN